MFAITYFAPHALPQAVGLGSFVPHALPHAPAGVSLPWLLQRYSCATLFKTEEFMFALFISVNFFKLLILNLSVLRLQKYNKIF